MSQEEVLRMVASARDNASGPMRKVENALRGFGKSGGEQARQLRENFKGVHEAFGKVAEVGKVGVAPAIEAIGISSLSAAGAMAALVAGLKGFVDRGNDVAAFGRKTQLTIDTIRELEGVAPKLDVDPSAVRQGLQGFTDVMYEVRRRHGEAYEHMKAQRLNMANELAATPETTEGNERALQIYLKNLEAIKKQHGMPTARKFAQEMGGEAFVDLLAEGSGALDRYRKEYRKLAGDLDPAAAKRWKDNWNNFTAAIEGLRNAVGGDLLPDLTALAKQAQEFFAEHKVEIAKEIASSVREIGSALHGVNEGVQAIGGWKVVFEGLIALKLVSLAANILKVASALRAATAAFVATPAGLLAAAGIALYETVKPQPAGESDAAEKARRDKEIAASGGARNQREASERAAANVVSPAAIIQGLRDRGLDATHAALLAGNIEQESGFDPTRPNKAEGGIGLIQWRKERREALKAFAARRHTLETDLDTQLDFLMKEIRETPEGLAFLARKTPEDVNSALHRHIRYGDASEGTRLAYGKRLLPLAERTQPGSILAAAGKSGMMGGGATTVTGSASLDVNVKAPPGTSVRASGDGLFDKVNVNRGLSLPKPLGDDQ